MSTFCIRSVKIAGHQHGIISIRGHPHSTYAQLGGEGSSQMCTTAYKGEGVSRLRTYARKKFFGPQNLKTFLFCTKEAITMLL